MSYSFVSVPPVGEVVLTAWPVAGSYSVVDCGTAWPSSAVTRFVSGRPAAPYVVVVVRVTAFAVKVTLTRLPHQSYSVVVAGSWDGLLPPPVIASAAEVEQTWSAHSGRLWQCPAGFGPYCPVLVPGEHQQGGASCRAERRGEGCPS